MVFCDWSITSCQHHSHHCYVHVCVCVCTFQGFVVEEFIILQEYRGLPEFDLPATLADISLSQQVLGYAPRVAVEEGLREFVHWFKEYMLLRRERKET